MVDHLKNVTKCLLEVICILLKF